MLSKIERKLEMGKIGRKCREFMVEQLVKRFEGNKDIVITNYTGLKVGEIEELKSALKKISAQYTIVKNSLVKRAFEQLDLKEITGLVEGAVAVGTGSENAVGISKILVDFKKKYSPFVIRGGFLDREVVSVEVISELAALPTREVLLTKFVCGLKSPINGFVGGLSGILRKFICVIDAIKVRGGEK